MTAQLSDNKKWLSKNNVCFKYADYKVRHTYFKEIIISCNVRDTTLLYAWCAGSVCDVLWQLCTFNIGARDHCRQFLCKNSENKINLTS